MNTVQTLSNILLLVGAPKSKLCSENLTSWRQSKLGQSTCQAAIVYNSGEVNPHKSSLRKKNYKTS